MKGKWLTALAVIFAAWLAWRFLKGFPAEAEDSEGGSGPPPGDEWREPDRPIDDSPTSSPIDRSEGSSWQTKTTVWTIVNGQPVVTAIVSPNPNAGADYALEPS